MKRKKRICGILLMITALIMIQLPVAEADAATSASDFKMEGSTLVKYQGKETNVSVPDTVKVIGESAFEGNTRVELVVVPNSVTKIEPYAFWGCENLDTVVLGKGLKEVGDCAFAGCKGLEQMSIPSNITNIGLQAFADCVNMTDITIPPETISIHETAFDGCYKLVMHCEAGTIADSYATDFYERQKEMPEYEDVTDYQPQVTVTPAPGDVNNQENPSVQPTQTPGVDTSQGRELGSTKIVGNRAFVFIDNTSLNVIDGTQPIEELQPVLSEAETYPKYTIVDGKIVADQAYYRNTELTKVVLPEGISEVGQFSFARSSLQQIALPEGTTQIGYGAFYHCDSLSNVSLPTTISVVEPKAFLYSAWVDSFLSNGTGDFLISGNTLVAYRGNTDTVLIPDGVKVIAGEAFMDHSEIGNVVLPDSLLTVGEGAFENCQNLSQVQLGGGVTDIKDRAFSGCNLKSVTVPASVERLGIQAFDENVQIIWQGNMPESTHEISAERLSNESYRGIQKTDNGEAGVEVVGLEDSFAELEGATRKYTLQIQQDADKGDLEKAYQRSVGTALPENTLVYSLQLSDSSEIAISKLGKQMLHVTIPVSEAFTGQNVRLIILDRNGQLEEVQTEVSSRDNKEYLSFSVNHLSVFGLIGTGERTEPVFEMTNDIRNMGAPVMEESPLKWFTGLRCMGCVIFFAGMILTGTSFRKSKSN